ncbi:MAG: histidinol-phosphate transaminase [Clostridia bacterium]|nr:histidinol-phosphate transaminase [Clostridia bacterium]
MSQFLRPALAALDPYVPGEQPQDKSYIKLNTNENPYPPAPGVMDVITREAVSQLKLYSDPTIAPLKQAIADQYGLKPENIFVTNGSDETLGFSFLAYADEKHPVTIPDISYGFYKVFAQLFQVAPTVIPLREDFTLPVEKFCGAGSMVVFANPNAPTAIALPLSEVEKIVASNPEHVVLVDEAYVDFGGESAVSLIERYPNLLVVRTFSKSRSLAGARIGYALAQPGLIDDLERVRNSFHPYNINRLSMLAGVEAMKDIAYFESCCQKIMATRRRTAEALKDMGFTMTESSTNFLFAAPPGISGREYYEQLKERGVLVRYFGGERLSPYVRITIGSDDEMDVFLAKTREILKEANP